MNQPTFFGPEPEPALPAHCVTMRRPVHNTDPGSSRVADDLHRASGARATNLSLVLDLVRRAPGHTSGELFHHVATPGERATLGSVLEVRRRCSDLSRCKPPLIARSVGYRPCRAEKSSQVEWSPVPEPRP